MSQLQNFGFVVEMRKAFSRPIDYCHQTNLFLIKRFPLFYQHMYLGIHSKKDIFKYINFRSVSIHLTSPIPMATHDYKYC